ncbi:MAG: DNA-3-methyladenine glycosylase 2 family protein [Clostridiales bacterium]|nr:DNA-3-methyladenine glycosylase 2 family protein [Clostridiales bacterium]
MRYDHNGDMAVLSGLDSFDIGQTLECGQCFRYRRLSGAPGFKEYCITAHGKLLLARQADDLLYLYPTTRQEYKTIWASYFDTRRDYASIKNDLKQRDPIAGQAAQAGGGIRILKQDPWECLVSFIISQNNNIPRIKKIIDSLCKNFGDSIGWGVKGFPTPKKLASLTDEDMAVCKAGFRTKYILEAAQRVHSGQADFSAMADLPTLELKKQLMAFKGVGPKIADCELLFAFGRTEVFPTDVWIQRIMRNLYFKGEEVPLKDIQALALAKFGSNAGFAQQYLYYKAQFD